MHIIKISWLVTFALHHEYDIKCDHDFWISNQKCFHNPRSSGSTVLGRKGNLWDKITDVMQ